MPPRRAQNVTLVYKQALRALADTTHDMTSFATPERMRFVNCGELVTNSRLQILEVLDYASVAKMQYSVVS